MGVILKLFHRGDNLGKPAYRNLFMDMEENIHIHYRDLRIELSRAEFEELAHTFNTQSAELLDIIRRTGYRDGVLPNANREDVRIWTDSRLKTPVAYHPRRISIEQCTDGVHLHLRNYKLLVSLEEFRELVDIFSNIQVDQPFAGSLDEVIELLKANDIDFSRQANVAHAKNKPIPSTGFVTVAGFHEPKLRGVLTGIGMQREVLGNRSIYRNQNVAIEVRIRPSQPVAASAGKDPAAYVSLVEYLSRGDAVNPDRINLLKAQVLDTFAQVANSETAMPVNLDYRSWIYDSVAKQVIFPFSGSPVRVAPWEAYRSWSNFLKKHDLFFVKPTKLLFPAAEQDRFHRLIIDRIVRDMTAIPAVSRVYIMGSVLRGQVGVYRAPLIHSRWAKLASDVDILIEMSEQADFEEPDGWEYINVSSVNQCDIYHIGQIKTKDRFRFQQRFPNIRFFHHLLDAYVFFPSKGDPEKKNAFLKRFGARMIFERESDKRELLDRQLKFSFGADARCHDRMRVTSENTLYEVDIGGNKGVLKVYSVAGNYNSKRLLEHTRYECGIVEAVAERGVYVPRVMTTKQGDCVFEVDGRPAVVYQKINGVSFSETDLPLREAGRLLARFHKVQIEQPPALKSNFSFDDVFKLWHKEFHRFAREVSDDAELTHRFVALEGVHQDLPSLNRRLGELDELHRVHNHGDVQPRNFIMAEKQAWLIDLQNAYFGPRLFDLVEGAIEFSWCIKNPRSTDFSRFQEFMDFYQQVLPLNATEAAHLDDVIRIVGVIKFIKEVRMLKGSRNKNNLRRQRALHLSDFLRERVGFESTLAG